LVELKTVFENDSAEIVQLKEPLDEDVFFDDEIPHGF